MTRRTDAPAATVKLVRLRDGMRCARCGQANNPLTSQHRVARGMGGTKDDRINLPSNLLTLCGSGTTGCHGQVERNPTWAKAHGLSVPWWANPAEVPAFTWRGWVLLLEDGNLTRDDTHPGVPGCDCGCAESQHADLFA